MITYREVYKNVSIIFKDLGEKNKISTYFHRIGDYL